MTFIHTRPTFIPIHRRLEIPRTMKNKRGRRLKMNENIIFRHDGMVRHKYYQIFRFSLLNTDENLFCSMNKSLL